MNYGLIRWLIVSCIYMHLLFFPVIAGAETDQDMDTWTYQKQWDKLSNLNYSVARSPMPNLKLYDNIRLELNCQNNQLQLVTKTSNLITSQGREFDFEYQIDKNPPVVIKFRTFKDNKRRGFSDEKIDQIAGDLLSGQSIFIRISTIIGSVLSAAIPLKDASGSIQKVLADCGIKGGKTPVQGDYSVKEFEQDFAKLTPEQQKQALDEIKKIMVNFR